MYKSRKFNILLRYSTFFLHDFLKYYMDYKIRILCVTDLWRQKMDRWRAQNRRFAARMCVCVLVLRFQGAVFQLRDTNR